MHLSCCGIDCESCDAFIATKNDDQTLRTQTALKWTDDYHHPFKPEDINCTGCHGDGAQIGHCSQCGVRKCATSRGMENCGVCPDYSCQTLENFYEMIPPQTQQEMRGRLDDACDALLGPDIPTE